MDEQHSPLQVMDTSSRLGQCPLSQQHVTTDMKSDGVCVCSCLHFPAESQRAGSGAGAGSGRAHLLMRVPNSRRRVFWKFSLHSQLHWSLITTHRMFSAVSARAVSEAVDTHTHTVRGLHTHTLSVDKQ